VGLWGKPSVLNNVETWANVPLIINGADWFIKRNRTSRVKDFFLVGKITNVGLVEVPMGTLRYYLQDWGNPGNRLKQQTGASGCIPEAC
jgi:NADH-quinone oxidoreductase subunit F